MESQPILATILLPHMLGQAVWEGFLLHEDVDNESCPTSPLGARPSLRMLRKGIHTLIEVVTNMDGDREMCNMVRGKLIFFFQSQCLRGESLLLAKILPCVMGEIVTLIFK